MVVNRAQESLPSGFAAENAPISMQQHILVVRADERCDGSILSSLYRLSVDAHRALLVHVVTQAFGFEKDGHHPTSTSTCGPIGRGCAAVPVRVRPAWTRRMRSSNAS